MPHLFRILFLAVFGSSLVWATSSLGEVIHRTQTIWYLDGPSCFGIPVGGETIDFSAQETVSIWTGGGDLGVSFGVCGGSGQFDPLIYLMEGATGMAVPETPLEELATAPSPPYGRFWSWMDLNTTYVVLTPEGLYVKFAQRAVSETFCCYAEVEIEYYVQTDGTRSFVPELPVESTTWGRIKALYR